MLNHDLLSISKYLKCNELVVNLDKNKTEAMLFGTAKRLQLNPKQLELQYDQIKISASETYTHQRSTLDPHLNLSQNFNKKYKKTLSKLRLPNNISHLISTKAVTLTCNAMILPVIKFNCIVHMKLTMGQEKKLRSLNHRARLVTMSNTNNIKSIMENHTVVAQTCLDENACNTFNKYFEFNHHNKSTRNNDVLLKVPRVKLEMAKVGFFLMGVKCYNSLSLEI